VNAILPFYEQKKLLERIAVKTGNALTKPGDKSLPLLPTVSSIQYPFLSSVSIVETITRNDNTLPPLPNLSSMQSSLFTHASTQRVSTFKEELKRLKHHKNSIRYRVASELVNEANGKEFRPCELAQRLGAKYSSVYAALRSLTRHHILHKRRKGMVNYYALADRRSVQVSLENNHDAVKTLDKEKAFQYF
jgi:DNA-binding transcriptional ArsR family regulator